MSTDVVIRQITILTSADFRALTNERPRFLINFRHSKLKYDPRSDTGVRLPISKQLSFIYLAKRARWRKCYWCHSSWQHIVPNVIAINAGAMHIISTVLHDSKNLLSCTPLRVRQCLSRELRFFVLSGYWGIVVANLPRYWDISNDLKRLGRGLNLAIES